MPAFQILFHSKPRSTVVVAAVPGILQHLVVFDEVLEPLLGDKVVAHPIDLPFPGGPGGGGNRVLYIVIALHERAHDRALAHTGWSGHHDQKASCIIHHPHPRLRHPAGLPPSRAVQPRG